MRSVTSDGHSVLHLAAVRRNTVLASVLIELGADVDQRDAKGNSPLHIAARRVCGFVFSVEFRQLFKGDVKMAEALLAGNATVDAANEEGNTPLIVAAMWNNRESPSAFRLE